MSDYSFTIVCPCCAGAEVIRVEGSRLEAWRDVAQRGLMRELGCAACGCQYDLVDHVTSIGHADKSKPAIAARTPGTSARGGGATVTLTGHALDRGTLVVKFGGVAGVNVRERSSSSAKVDCPPCPKVKIFTQGQVEGPFAVGQLVTGASSLHTGTVLELGDGYVVLQSPTGGFAPGEWLEASSGGRLRIDDSAYWHALVDLEVLNEHGQRVQGAKLVGEFVYGAE